MTDTITAIKKLLSMKITDGERFRCFDVTPTVHCALSFFFFFYKSHKSFERKFAALLTTRHQRPYPSVSQFYDKLCYDLYVVGNSMNFADRFIEGRVNLIGG